MSTGPAGAGRLRRGPHWPAKARRRPRRRQPLRRRGLGAGRVRRRARPRGAATVAGRASELGTRTLCWEILHHVDAPGFVEGTVLAAYEYRVFKTEADDAPKLDELIVSAHHDTTAEVERGGGRRGRQRGARPRTRPPTSWTPERSPSAPARLPGLDVEVGPRGDRGGRDGRVRGRGARHRGAPARSRSATSRPAPPARCSASSARATRLRRHLDHAVEDERDEVRCRRRGRAGGDRRDRPAGLPRAWCR